MKNLDLYSMKDVVESYNELKESIRDFIIENKESVKNMEYIRFEDYSEITNIEIDEDFIRVSVLDDSGYGDFSNCIGTVLIPKKLFYEEE